MSGRLSASSPLPAGVSPPGYVPEAHGRGIVHLGPGSFHKAHQAFYTDAALAADGGDWRILGVTLRGGRALSELAPQDGRYTLLERGADGARARVIGSVAGVASGAGGSDAALAALTAPWCRVVTLTVTEKAYGLDRAGGGCASDHPAVSADLASPESPRGVLGLIVRALALRRRGGLAPFTVVCCDNLPRNGVLLSGAAADFARRIDSDLGDWIASEVSFPSTVVDRITPAPTERTCAEAARLLGVEDRAAVETETFHQWVIEDDFPAGRPAWEAGGAIFVKNVGLYELMKLRVLNGTHSMLSYAGFHSGLVYVRDVMSDVSLSCLVRRYMSAAQATFDSPSGVDAGEYARVLADRFSNPYLAHETRQIAMDGTEKLPQRVFAAALDARARGIDIRPFAFATAAWMFHATASGRGGVYELIDPRAGEIRACLRGVSTGSGVMSALFGLSDFMPVELSGDADWRDAAAGILEVMLSVGMRAAVEAEAVVD
ncbi:MAG: mannitol dehydrogenase family protein [Alphaproteobacteria bacterium]|nr:mannitol dehydrogenase family protein [Alphaproteobacteria bacterium]MDA7988444.1 mannitol dehydrogenase family protein [Alphaproteobacteria bacterium]MDA8008817.1 mannitol dehydrogenase family protein [Alphaproteobacteria bacterium]